jgi:hypothetical protein
MIGTILAVFDCVEDGREYISQERRSLGKRWKPEALPSCEMDGEGGVERNFGKGEGR